MKKILLTGAAISCLLIALSSCSFRKDTTVAAQVKLTFYGLDEPSAFSSIISDYQASHSNVRITYKKFDDPAAFENVVINEIAEGAGPDVFYVHNTWLPKHIKKLVPLVSDTFTPSQFNDAYVKVASDDFIQPDPIDGKNKIYSLPLYVDTLALYYNKKFFDQQLPERGKPGATWDLIQSDAPKFLQQDKDNKLTMGEIAMGRADSITLAPDILYNLFLQAGENFYNSTYSQIQLGQAAQRYFDYYLSFSSAQNKNFSWNNDLVSSNLTKNEVDAFMAGKVAAIFGYSDLYPRLQRESKNIKDISVAPSPQISQNKSEYKVLANYYGVGVSRNSKNSTEAWNFVRFLGSKNQAVTFHKKTTRPTARRDLIEDQRKEAITDVFVSQLGYAASLRIFSDQQFGAAIRDAVTAANSGQTSRSALDQAEKKMNDLLETEAPNGLYPKVKK